MPDFNPANTEIANGWETDGHGIQAALIDGFHRLGPGGELLTPTFNGVPVNEIDGLAVDQGDVSTTVGLGPKAVNMRLRNTVGQLRYWARFLRHSATPTTPAGGTLTRQHILDQEQTDIDFEDTLTVDIQRDNGLFWSHRGVDVQSMVLTLEGGELTNSQAVLMWRQFTHFADKTVVSDITPNTKQPELTGLLNLANFNLGIAAQANSVHLQVADISGLPTSVDLLAKVGAGVFGANAFTVLIGNLPGGSGKEPRLVRVTDSTTQQDLGTCSIPVYVSILDGTDYEVAVTPDEWTWDQKAAWAPTLGTAPVFNNACAIITIGGVEKILNSATVTMTRNLVLPGAGSWFGSGFPLTLTEAGRVRYEITFAKDQLDTETVTRIIYNDPFNVKIDLRSGAIIDAGFPYDDRFTLELNDCRSVGGSEHKTVTAEDDREETITCVASGSPPARLTLLTPITDLAV